MGSGPVPVARRSTGYRHRPDRSDTPLLDAPIPDASVLEIILEGQSVILTGATVDGYDAAAHDGTGGWVDERDLSR